MSDKEKWYTGSCYRRRRITLDGTLVRYFTTKPKGSGIGLAMTYRILQMHGGAMDVRSNADRLAADHGTTFTFAPSDRSWSE